MSATYSINIGNTTEAVSFNNISAMLNGLPNNTNRQITPRDVRNAVFSNWEMTIFKYTTAGTNEYIGIDRDDIKDKIFIGKKKLNTTNIISNTLASSDVDIFFYNTKSDTASSQTTKIQFLGGDDASIHQYAPYLSVQKVAGLTPSLSLTLAHTNPFGGDFNFQAGNDGRISLNNLVFPSVNELSLMGSNQVISTDRFLVRTQAGFVELKTASFSSATLPTFTDALPTPVDFGGIPAGSTFSNVPLEEMIRQMLYPYLGPLASILITNSVRERNHVASDIVNYEYTLTKRTAPVTSQITFDGATPPIAPVVGPSIGGSSFVTNTYTASQTLTNVQIQNSTSGTFTFSVIVTDGTQSSTASQQVNYVYPYYYGFSPTTSSPEAQIASGTFSKLIDVYASQSVALAGTGYLHFCYPETYGDINEIYDSNGFLLYQGGSASTSWTYSTVGPVSSELGIWSGVSYRIYRTTSQVTIPLPSELYEFNF